MQEINEKEKLIREEVLSKKWPVNLTLFVILVIGFLVWQLYNIKTAIIVFVMLILLFMVFFPVPGFIVKYLIKKQKERSKK